jgi:hypothetical protein
LRVNWKYPFLHRESIPVQVVDALLTEAFKSVVVERGRGLFGASKTAALKPENISGYYHYYKNDSAVASAINSLTEKAVGQGFYLTVDKDQKALDLCNEFNQEMNLDHLLPNITRNMLIAGYLPVETQLNKLPSKCALKIIHPETIGKTGGLDLKDGGLLIDNNTGEFQGLTQKGTKEMLKAEDIALFVYNQLGNDIRGVSHIQPVYPLLAYKESALQQMDKILKRYASPKGVWKTTAKTGALRELVEASEPGEDIFIGEIPSADELKDLVQFLDIDPRARFWEYIEYIDQLIYEGLRGPNLAYWRNATEASATILNEIVEDTVHAIQRSVKRTVEASWYAPLCKLNNCSEVPKIEWGMEKTGIEDIDISEFLKTCLEIGIISPRAAIKLLNQMGVRIEDEEPEGEEEPSGAAQVPEETPPKTDGG